MTKKAPPTPRWPAIEAMYEAGLVELAKHDATCPGPEYPRRSRSHYRRHEDLNKATNGWRPITNPAMSRWLTSYRHYARLSVLAQFAQAKTTRRLMAFLEGYFFYGGTPEREAFARGLIADLPLKDLTRLLAFSGRGGEHLRALALEALATVRPEPTRSAAGRPRRSPPARHRR